MTSLSVAAALLGDAMLYVVMPSRPELWHLTIIQVGILLSINRLVRLFTNPLSSVFVEKFGIYTPFRVSLLSSLGVLVAYAFSKNFIVLVFARLLWGTCWSTLRLVSQWVASENSTAENLGFNLSSNVSIIRVGSIGGAVFGGVLSDYLGYEAAFIIFGVFTLMGFAAWIRQSTYKNRKQSVVTGRKISGFIHVLRDSRVLILSIASMFGGLVFSGLIGATIGHFLRHRYGLEFDLISITFGVATITGFALGLKSLAEVLVGPFGGYFSDRYGRYKSLVISAALTSLGLLFLGFSNTIFVTFSVLLLVFIAGVMLMMQLLSLLGMIVDDQSRSQVFSVFNTFQDFGSALGPLIGLSLISANLLPALYSISGILLFILIVGACLFLNKDTVGKDPQ
ncbi:MAG: MFS transporter [Chloroflexota bacterium]|nr:MFS transporter [Chloroflexota bacterium]